MLDRNHNRWHGLGKISLVLVRSISGFNVENEGGRLPSTANFSAVEVPAARLTSVKTTRADKPRGVRR